MKKLIILILLSTSALSACSDGEGASVKTEATKTDVLTAIAPKISSISPLPSPPDPVTAKSSVAGIDTNTNGVRDDIEIVLAKTILHDGGTASASDFSKLLDTIKIIQPSETTNIIDMKKFYCSYQSMPPSIKEKVSASMLITLATDTPARKKAYFDQSINTSGSLGAEICE